MPKLQKIYICSKCDTQALKWSGRCMECGAWGTLGEQVVEAKKDAKLPQSAPAEIIDLDKISGQNLDRIKTNISELDRVLGGGLVPGSLILLGGEPGIGKSTIVAQMAGVLIGRTVVYVSGEESALQIKNRFERLRIDPSSVKFINETNLDKVISAVKNINASLLIIDSIQTVYSNTAESEAGSVSQIRACAVNLLELAKGNNISVVIIGHITKDGQVAGPKTLEHIVDTVIYLEADPANNMRLLRATKNRFGSTNELGVFTMTGTGFQEITNPSAIFIESHQEKISGSAISSIIEGSRPFLVEIQALVSKTVFGYPQRKASGYDLNRLQVLSTVISKRTKANLNTQDIILNIVGGFKVNDPSLDLAVCASIISSMLNRPLDRKTLILGEVGLGGEVRAVARLEERLKDAQKLGFNRFLIPNQEIKAGKIETVKIKNLEELTDVIK